jgi:uncharacterized protein (DUF2384 family)
MTQVSTAPLFQSVPDDVFHLFEEDGQPQAQKVVDLLKYKKADVAAATNVPLSSIRYDAKMPDELRERITEWAIAINLVGGFFENETKTMLWLQTPNPLLGDLSPREMIRTGRFKKLLKLIRTALAENTR